MAALDTYHGAALAHRNTALLCAQHGIVYIPRAFAAQGGYRAAGRGRSAPLCCAGCAERIEEVVGHPFVVDFIFTALARLSARAVLRRCGRSRPAARRIPDGQRHDVRSTASGAAADDADDDTDDAPTRAEDIDDAAATRAPEVASSVWNSGDWI